MLLSLPIYSPFSSTCCARRIQLLSKMTDAAHPPDIAAAHGLTGPSRWMAAFLLGLLATAFFFRSILPRLPRILFRGKLRIRRAGIRGIRGIEYRSKGFHNNSAAFSRHEGQLELKIQRLYASYHLPYFMCKSQDRLGVVPPRSGAMVTIHVQGVGVHLPRSEHHRHQGQNTASTQTADEADASHGMTLEQQEELRLQQLMSSRSASPTTEANQPFLNARFRPRSTHTTLSGSSGPDGIGHTASSWRPEQGGVYQTFQKAGVVSFRSVLGLAAWLRGSAVPALKGIILRAFRAALFILTSSVPVLTSLVSIEVDRIEVYFEEVEAVARIGRAGVTFCMSPDSLASEVRVANDSRDVVDVDASTSYLRAPTLTQFFDAMRQMPTRVGSGARGAASYLVAGMSPSNVSANIRVDSIEFFEAHFQPESKPERSTAHAWQPAPSNLSSLGTRAESQSDTEPMVDTSTHGDSVDGSSRRLWPSGDRGQNASPLRRTGSSRGFADRWTDWALEPLVDSNFHADSGWSRNHPDKDVSSRKFQTIPSSARIVSISGVTELKASLLVGSNLALGGDGTLAAKLVLGEISVGLDAAHRLVCAVEERKARRSGWAPTTHSATQNQRSVLSKHLVQQSPTATAMALRMMSSISLALPSVSVTASSDALLSSVASCATETEDGEKLTLPSREVAMSLIGFRFELKRSDPKDELHRRWLGTCGLSKSTSNKGLRKGQDSVSGKHTSNSEASTPRGAKAVEHRRTFLVELSFDSFEIHCGACERNRGSRLLSIDESSIIARSSWTPFGLFPACPQAERLLLAGDPNEHTCVIETLVGGVQSDVPMDDVTVLVSVANEFRRRRQKQRQSVGIDHPPRPKTDLERLRRLPKIASVFHVQRISLLLDASREESEESMTTHKNSSASSKAPISRKLTLSVPNVDFVLFGEYRDEYIRRPSAEKRAAYKALKDDSLEWPISGRAHCLGADNSERPSSHEVQRLPRDSSVAPSDGLFTPAPLQTSAVSSQRYKEASLTMEETLKRMLELEKLSEDRGGPDTAQHSSFREVNFKSGKNGAPSYRRKTSMAADTRFSLCYQFETDFRIDAVECFLSINPSSQNSSEYLRQPSSPGSSDVGSSQHHLLAMHSFEIHGSGRVPGDVESRGSVLCDDIPRLSAQDAVAEFRASIEDVDVEAWQSCALDTYADIASTIVQAKQRWSAHGKSDTEAKVRQADLKMDEDANAAKEQTPLVQRLPAGLAVYISIGRTIAHLGGPDRRIKDRVARGIGFEAERIVIEYAALNETKLGIMPQKTNWGARLALELSEDLQLQALSLASRHGQAVLARIVLHQAGIFPMLDAALATQQHTEGTASETFARAKALKGEGWPKEQPENEVPDRPATSLLADSVWTFSKDEEHIRKSTQHRPRFRQQDRSNFIFFVPYAAFKTVVRPPHAETKSGLVGTSEDEVFITSEDTNFLAFKIDLLHTYCILLAVSTFKNLMNRAKSAQSASVTEQTAKSANPTDRAAPSAKHRRPSVACRFDIKEVHTFVTLPRSTRIFMRMRRVEIRQSPKEGLSVSLETVMAAVESPKQAKGDVWDEAVRLRDWRVTIPPKTKDKKLQVDINGDAGLIRIPYGYAVNPIIDNTSVAFKATKQLVYQFLQDKDDSIIAPHAEDPKLVPDINFNLRVLTLEAEDDPFETKLNLIWRAGLAENMAREEREVAFAAKAETISAMERRNSSASFRSFGSDDSLTSSGASFDSDPEDGSSSISSERKRPPSTRRQHVTYDEARMALDAFNSSSWVRRYTNAQAEQTRRGENVLKNIYGRFSVSRSFDDLPVKTLPIGKAAPLFRSTMYRVGLQVQQAHFPVENLGDFVHEKGAGMPKDTPFSLVIPLHVKWEMEEWRITLRDYPMPMLHVPPTHRHETDARKAWCLEGDIVIGEQLGGPESIRHVPAVVVPAATGRPDAIEYGIMVPKVAMSVKMYGTPTVKLRTPFPTRLVWGQSIQPTIHDVMRVIDGITPPPHDPSPKLGFWDKLPLILHGHVNVKFEDEGGFNIHLKGSRDPYAIEGQAAGWVKSWKGGVEFRIGYDNPEKEFFQILSHEYVLAVPDLSDYADHAATGVLGGGDYSPSQPNHSHDSNSQGSYHDSHDRKSADGSVASSMHRYMKDPTFKKIVIKLTNGVRWGAGLHGERTCDDETCIRRPRCQGEPFYRECRKFERINHWEVVPKTYEYFNSIPESERRDSFRGWRSHHLHFSISVYSPKSGLPGYGGKEHVSRLDTVNNFYFSPLAWQHFWSWMRLFSSAMSLPIRTGDLFPESPPPSPKFGRFLGTIKYRIDLVPLFITHQYRQFSKEDWARGLRTHVGIKACIDSFTLDMHQRQQETVKDRPELGGPRIVFHKPFYEAEVKCETINLKAMAAQVREDEEMIDAMEDTEVGEDILEGLFAEDPQISDDELPWIDLNDLVELDQRPITDPSPKIRMFPAMICPQFHYYRKVDSQKESRVKEMSNKFADDAERRRGKSDVEELLSRVERSKFGHEDSHVCMVGQDEKPIVVQRKLAQERLQTIRREIDRVLAANGNASMASERGFEGLEDQQDRLNDLHERERILSGFISHLGRLAEHTERAERATAEGHPVPKQSSTTDRNLSLSASDLASLYHDLGTFDNRYVAHNPIIFFSNVTRTLLLKYYYSSRLRRGYAHHMTATAVRYIRDLLKKKDKTEQASNGVKQRKEGNMGRTPHELTLSHEGTMGLDILHEMLEDTVNHMSGKHGYSKSGWGCEPDEVSDDGLEAEMRPTDGISDDFNVLKSNVCLLLKPQVVLRSDVDDKSTVIVTALRTRLQNYTVRDETCADDSVNAVVLRRNFFALDNLQCYHPNAHINSKASKGDIVALPLESLVDMHGHARYFERIVPHTNATMYYDKFNKLRLSDSSRSVSTFRKDGKPVQDHLHHHMDMILLNCPRFSVSANGEHFAALYNVVTDLILYRDPAHRHHAKRLEEMMFSYDFTDVSGLADIVSALQVRIREARSLAEQYQCVADQLNEKGKADFVALRGEALELIEELNLIMDAITTSQDSKGGADREKKSALRFMTQAQDVAWNMIGDEAGQLVAKLALRGISFSWLNKADNSAANTLSIQDLQALNVDPNAVFAEIITKHSSAQNHPMAKEGRFLDAMWSVLPPVGGISIVDTFEFNLHPVKIQVELLVGRKIMDYIFGTKRQREKQEEEQKRLEIETNRSDNAVAKKKSPFARLLGGKKHVTPNSLPASSQTSHRPSTNENSSSPSVPDGNSKSASTTDLLSIEQPSSEGSREDDAESVSGRVSTKTMFAHSSTAKSSLKSRPNTPNSAKETGTGGHDPTDQIAIAQRNAAEMRSRASSYRTFVYVKISETIFCLSYKGEKQASITNLYDLVFKTPNFEYHNSTFGYVDLAENFKKDVFKAAWNQKSTLLRDIITHRPSRKRNAIESIRAIRQASRVRESLAPLDISVERPPKAAGDNTSFDGSSSFLVESPTDTFSYKGEEQDMEGSEMEGRDSGGDGDADEEERCGHEHEHHRSGTGQTIAGQIRDAWGRDNQASPGSSPQSEERPRDSVSEVEDLLTSEEQQSTPQRFPTLTRSQHSNSTGTGGGTDSPSTEGAGGGGGGSASSSPYLQLPPSAPFSQGRRDSASSRSHSPSFKLNKLIPKSLRPRASSSSSSATTTATANVKGPERSAEGSSHGHSPLSEDQQQRRFRGMGLGPIAYRTASDERQRSESATVPATDPTPGSTSSSFHSHSHSRSQYPS